MHSMLLLPNVLFIQLGKWYYLFRQLVDCVSSYRQFHPSLAIALLYFIMSFYFIEGIWLLIYFI